MTEENELPYWLAFNQISIIGPIRQQRLLNYFANLKDAWQAPLNELINAGLEPKIAEDLINKKSKINPKRELEKLEKINGQAITILDQNYPRLLKEIYAPPPLLYHLGEFDLSNDFVLAVVGTRKISDYGKQVTQRLTSDLALAGLTIISGLALGIDTCAHQAALNVNKKTISVLGSGLNQIYPATNRRLAEKIISSGGAVISEFPLEMPPLKHNFPLRNRIIAGLSLGTLITEAGEKSGALITAQLALEQNREVFAVPGNIYQTGSAGPNKLIKMGAKAVTSAADILETLNLSQANDFKAVLKLIPENEMEKNILKILDQEPLHIDKIVQSSMLDISVVNSTLSVMEMKGMIKNLGNQIYLKIY